MLLENASSFKIPIRKFIDYLLSHALNNCNSGFDDLALKNAMAINPMRGLRRFILTDASSVLVRNQEQTAAAATDNTVAPVGNEQASASPPENSSLALTSASVMRLFDECPLLQCVGDLRHWNIGSAERRAISKRIQEKTGVRWISTMCH